MLGLDGLYEIMTDEELRAILDRCRSWLSAVLDNEGIRPDRGRSCDLDRAAVRLHRPSTRVLPTASVSLEVEGRGEGRCRRVQRRVHRRSRAIALPSDAIAVRSTIFARSRTAMTEISRPRVPPTLESRPQMGRNIPDHASLTLDPAAA